MDYERQLKIKKNYFTYVISHSTDTHFLINQLYRTYCQVNDDFLEIFNNLEQAITIDELFTKYDLDDSFDEVFKALIAKGIIEDTAKKKEESEKILFPASPHNHLAIFPTHNCNLNCSYCYARGGEVKKDIDFKTIDIAIDYFFNSFMSKEAKMVGLDFHGGGEPTVAFDKVKYAADRFIEECRKRELKHHFAMATNTCFDNQVLDWIVENRVSLTVSFDGIKEIQDKNRTYSTGKGSYDDVVANIRKLQQHNVPFGIRVTVTKEYVDKMIDIVENAHLLGLDSVHFEPVFEVGRCESTKTEQPFWQDFSYHFLLAFKKAITYGIDIQFSGLRFMDSPRNHFCGACGSNFAVTPEGYLTTCYEVVHNNDPAAKHFFFGKIEPATEQVYVDEEKVVVLKNRTVEKMDDCGSCYVKWGCTGDCPVKGYRDTDSLYKVGEQRCELIKKVNREIIKLMLDNKYYPGNYINKFEYKGE